MAWPVKIQERTNRQLGAVHVQLTGRKQRDRPCHTTVTFATCIFCEVTPMLGRGWHKFGLVTPICA
eukprot:1181103-Amphidinium_carterae.1